MNDEDKRRAQNDAATCLDIILSRSGIDWTFVENNRTAANVKMGLYVPINLLADAREAARRRRELYGVSCAGL